MSDHIFIEKIKNFLTTKKGIILVAILIRIYVSFNLTGTLHSDEQFQGIEIAFYLLTPSRTEIIIPWEFNSATRSYLWPLILSPLLFFLLQFGFRGLLLFQLLHLTISLISLLTIPVIYNFYEDGSKNGYYRALIASWVIALYAPFVLLSNYITPDGIATVLLIISLPLASKELQKKTNKYHQILIGIVIGIIISLRFQFGLIWIPFGLISLYRKRLVTILGIIIGIIPLLALDWIFYGIPGITMWNFLHFNVINQTNVEFFGEVAWWFYPVTSFFLLYGVGFIILPIGLWMGRAFIKEKQILPLFVGVCLYLLVFQWLSFKEIRFILPVISFLVIISVSGIPILVDQMKRGSTKSWGKLISLILIIITLFSLIISPFNAIYGNVWLAQEKAREIDPNGSIALLGPWQNTGGYLLQYPTNFNSKMYFMDDMDNKQLIAIAKKVNLLILDRLNSNYLLLISIMHDNCIDPYLIANYDQLNELSLTTLYLQWIGNLNGYYIELWNCNLL